MDYYSNSRWAFSNYDWYDDFGSEMRTPEQYPYSFSTHWLQRPLAEGSNMIYSDRMRQWDSVAYARGVQQSGYSPMNRFRFDVCNKFIDAYYEGKAECVGYLLSCNVSNGYPIGIFCVKDK